MQTRYDVFISYSRADNADGRVTKLIERISEDYAAFAGRPLRLFLDKSEIAGMDDWRHRILEGLRESRLLLACLSPTYLRSKYCEWEFNEYLKNEVANAHVGDGVAPIYFVEVPGWHDKDFERQSAAWVAELRRRQYFDLRPWLLEGQAALHDAAVASRIRDLNTAVRSRVLRDETRGQIPGNVDAHNPHFVGRLTELRRLREAVALGRVGVLVAVHGLGGVGKTALAIEYAHAFAHEYGGGRWQVRCEGKEDLRDAIADLATPLGVEFTETEKRDGALRFERVLRALRERAESADPPRALLLLDNVDHAKLLEPAATQLLPAAGWLHVIATSRLGEGDLFGRHPDRAFVAVDELPEGDAIALIEGYQLGGRFRGDAEREAARGIVTLLGRFTLAVETTAVYLGEFSGSVTCAGFLARLRTEGLAGLDTAAMQASDIVLHREKRIAATLVPTLERLGPAETLALNYAALMPADHIPLPWIRALAAAEFPELGRDAAPGYPDPWITLVHRLLGLRLLQLTSTQDAAGRLIVCRMHRLVQGVCVARLADAAGLRQHLAAYALARGDAWVANALQAAPNAELGDLLFDVAVPMDFKPIPRAKVEGDVWEADCMLAFSHALMLRGEEQEGLRLSSSVATPIAIETLSQCLRPLLQSADQTAMSSKSRQVSLTRTSTVAAVIGLSAMLAPMLLPVFARMPPPGVPLPLLAAMALAATIVSVVAWVQIPATKARWLLNRYKCELCRQCEFRALTSEDLWSGRTQEWRDAMTKEADRIASVDVYAPLDLSAHAGPSATASASASALPGPLLDHIAGSYRRMRLEDQLEYYWRYPKRYQQRQGGWVMVARIAFLGGLIGAIACCAYLIVTSAVLDGALVRAAAAILLAALSVPLLSNTIRAVRRSLAVGAFLRETEATRVPLLDLHDALGRARGPAGERRSETLAMLQECERLMSAEFRSWYRSQIEFH